MYNLDDGKLKRNTHGHLYTNVHEKIFTHLKVFCD